MDRRSRTHGARFNCSKQFAVAEPVITEVLSGLAEGDDFGVGGGIVVGEIAIPSAAHHAPVADDYRSDGDFAGVERALGAAQGFEHPEFVGWVVGDQLPVLIGHRLSSFSERLWASATLQFRRGKPRLYTARLLKSRRGVSGATSRQCYAIWVMRIADLVRKVFLVDLIQGLGVTFRYQDPKEIYTEQYPLERPQVAERYRGAPRLNVNPDTEESLCISCDLCALACPENLIVVTSERNEKTRRKELINFTYDLSRCMFCGLCEDACPTDALELTQDFELANYTREGMIWDRQTLEKGPQPTVYKK